jgi:hypothetical protein
MASKVKIWPLIASAVTLLVLSGCSSNSGGDGIDPGAAKQLSDINTMAKQAGGDLDKLPPEGKQKIMDMAHGDEKQARALLKIMANPPGGGGGNQRSQPAPGK